MRSINRDFSLNTTTKTSSPWADEKLVLHKLRVHPDFASPPFPAL